MPVETIAHRRLAVMGFNATISVWVWRVMRLVMMVTVSTPMHAEMIALPVAAVMGLDAVTCSRCIQTLKNVMMATTSLLMTVPTSARSLVAVTELLKPASRPATMATPLITMVA